MISIIIPVLNEAQSLPATIKAVRQCEGSAELIVVDGGSHDGSPQLARELGARVMTANRRQRAFQMNLGAQHARRSALLFLHADTSLPPSALHRIAAALMDPSVGGGAFARRFDSASLFLKVTSALGELRNRAIGWHLGDQAMFVRREYFDRLHGFAELDQFEDLDFSRRLGEISRVVTLRPRVVSSARRFEREGPVRRTVKDFTLTLRYLRAPVNAGGNAKQSESAPL